MPLDVVGDEIVLDGQTVGFLIGCSAETSARGRILDALHDVGDRLDHPRLPGFEPKPIAVQQSDAEIVKILRACSLRAT